MKPSPPVTVTRRGVLIAAAIVGIAMGVALIAVVLIALKVNDVQQAEIKANGRDIAALKRTDERLKRIEQPTQEQLTQAALNALRAIRSCANSRACRRRNPGVAQVARSIPRGRIPRRVPRRRTSSSGGGGTTSGGGGTTTANPPSPRPQGPTQTARRPQPTVRPTPPAAAPATPPASRPTAPPAASNPPAPTPTPSTPVSPPQAPPAPPPPVSIPVPVPPVPPLPGVCTPVVNVNCPKAP